MFFVLTSINCLRLFLLHFISILRVGDIILLNGIVGVGKTELVRCILTELRFTESRVVSSPTFTLLNLYKFFCFYVCHCDFYRIFSVDFLNFNFEDFLFKSLVFVEWSDKLFIDFFNVFVLNIFIYNGVRVLEVYVVGDDSDLLFRIGIFFDILISL